MEELEFVVGGVEVVDAVDPLTFDHQQPLPVCSHVHHEDVASIAGQVLLMVEVCTIVEVHMDYPILASYQEHLVVGSDVDLLNFQSGLGEGLHCDGGEEAVKGGEYAAAQN